MFCSECGKQIDDPKAFCPHCGVATNSTAQQQTATAKLPPSQPAQPPGGYYPQQTYYPPPTPAPKKSRKGLGCGGAILLILIVVVIVIIASSSGKKTETPTTPASTSTTPAPAASNTTFDQVGVHDAPAVHVESYYVANPTKSAIQKFCEERRRYYENIRQGQHIILNFYDDMAHTPNYTQGWNPDDPNSEPYYVCNYVWDRQGPTGSIEFYKQIPE